MSETDPTGPGALSERRGAIPLWRSAAESLERELRAGKYGPGDQLPPEGELQATYGVHRNTVRHAMNALRERGFVRIEQGRGTFVKERIVRYELGPKSRLTSALRDISRLGQRRFIGATRVRANTVENLARRLKIKGTQYTMRIDTLTLVDGIGVSLTSSYFPLPRFDQIDRAFEETCSFTESLKRCGVTDYRRQESTISACLISTKDAKILGLRPRDAALLISNTSVDASNVPIDVSHARMSPQHLELVVRFDY